MKFITLLRETLAYYKKHFLQIIALGAVLFLLPLSAIILILIYLSHLFPSMSWYLFILSNNIIPLAGALYMVGIIKYMEYGNLKQTLSKDYYGRALLLRLIEMVVLAISYTLFIIPGIIMHIYLIFSQYILVLENKGIFASIKASMSLVQGNWWRVFFNNLFLLLFIMASSVLILPLFMRWPIVVYPFLDIAMPVILIFNQRLYKDLKDNT